ncbi:MAG: hypothetical protein ACFCUG_05405 [Thiotrichales bacterium]
MQLIRLTQQHRGLTAGVLGGNEGLKSVRASTQLNLDARLAGVASAAKGFGDARIMAEIEAIRRDWSSLKAAVESGAA